jgi:methionyl-tRNA formyltransferase
VNIHPVLLPRYRGPHPTVAMVIDRTITEAAGVTLHVMSQGLDEGDIIAQQPVSFPADADMMRHLIHLGQAVADIVRIVPAYLRHEIVPVAQDEAAASYRKVDYDRDLVIGPQFTAEYVAWLCSALPPIGRCGSPGLAQSACGRRSALSVRLPAKRPWSVLSRSNAMLPMAAF